MNVNEHVFGDIDTYGGGEIPPRTGFIPDALPEAQKSVLAESLQTGVSTQNALHGTISKVMKKQLPKNNWYVLRVTYGREQSAYDYLVSKKIEAFYPTMTTVRLINGKRKHVVESRFPNIFFARGTEEEIKSYVYDNINLPYLRFYYHHLHAGTQIIKKPLIVPNKQMESLKIICASEAQDIILVSSDVNKFKAGQMVRIIDGSFKGVIGKVARYQGQQRVAVIIDGLLTIATAYIPSAFMVPLK